MLRELTVNNLAVIEDVRIELAAGFCAWTGETGAGKSLILGALGLLLGRARFAVADPHGDRRIESHRRLPARRTPAQARRRNPRRTAPGSGDHPQPPAAARGGQPGLRGRPSGHRRHPEKTRGGAGRHPQPIGEPAAVARQPPVGTARRLRQPRKNARRLQQTRRRTPAVTAAGAVAARTPIAAPARTGPHPLRAGGIGNRPTRRR